MDSQSEPHSEEGGACITGCKAQSLHQLAGRHQSKTVGICPTHTPIWALWGPQPQLSLRDSGEWGRLPGRVCWQPSC